MTVLVEWYGNRGIPAHCVPIFGRMLVPVAMLEAPGVTVEMGVAHMLRVTAREQLAQCRECDPSSECDEGCARRIAHRMSQSLRKNDSRKPDDRTQYERRERVTDACAEGDPCNATATPTLLARE